jgi:hypothetical protein
MGNNLRCELPADGSDVLHRLDTTTGADWIDGLHVDLCFILTDEA